MSVCMLAFAQATMVCTLLNQLTRCWELLGPITIQGSLFGKNTGAVLAIKTRAMLPFLLCWMSWVVFFSTFGSLLWTQCFLQLIVFS